MNFNNIKVMISKEFARVFKDKKLVFSLFILPAVLVICIYSVMGIVIDAMQSDIEEHKAVVYFQNAPEGLKEIASATGYDKTADIVYLNDNATGIDAIKEDILNGDADLLVYFDKDFTQKINSYEENGQLPVVKISYNSAKNYSVSAENNFVTMVLSTYKTAILAERLGNLEVLTVFNTVEDIIVNEDEANGQMLAMMLPYLITFLLFASAMGLVVDAVAGEKERGTMSRLLMTPARRSELAFAKILALTALSVISSFFYAGAMVISLPNMMGSTGETNFHFSVGQVVSLFVLLMILAYLYVALITFVAIHAKDSKEATSFVTPLYIVVLMAAMTTMFSSGTTLPTFVHIIPIYGTAVSIQNLLINNLSGGQLALSIVGNFICAGLLTFGVTKAFNSEKVMFNA